MVPDRPRRIADVYDRLTILYANLGLFQESIEYRILEKSYFPRSSTDLLEYQLFSERCNLWNAHDLLALYEHTDNKRFLTMGERIIRGMPVKSNTAYDWLSFYYLQLAKIQYLRQNYAMALHYIDSSLLPQYYNQVNTTRDNNQEKFAYRGFCLLRVGRGKEGYRLLQNIAPQYDHRLNHAIQTTLYEYAMRDKKYQTALYYAERAKSYRDSLALNAQRTKVFKLRQAYEAATKQYKIEQLSIRNQATTRYQNKILLIVISALLLLLAVYVSLYSISYQRKLRNLQISEAIDKKKANLISLLASHEQKVQQEKDEAMHRVRQRLSRAMHDELASALSALQFYVQDLELQAHGRDRKILGKVEMQVTQVIEQAGTYITNLRRGLDSISGLATFLNALSTHFNQDNGLQITTTADTARLQEKLSKEQQMHLELMIKEAVTNAMKHASASKIHINIALSEQHCHFQISDNGKGYTKTQKTSKGMGVANMQRRIQLLNGQLEIRSLGAGCTIVGSFPLRPNG